MGIETQSLLKLRLKFKENISSKGVMKVFVYKPQLCKHDAIRLPPKPYI